MLLSSFQRQGVIQEESSSFCGDFSNDKLRQPFNTEPTSVLNRIIGSPSTQNSSSELSFSFGSARAAAGGVASSGSAAGAPDFNHVPVGIDAGPDKCNWEAMFPSNGNDSNFLHSSGFGYVDSLVKEPVSGMDPLSLIGFQEPIVEKQHPVLNWNNVVLNQNRFEFSNQNPSFFLPLSQFVAPSETHNAQFVDSSMAASNNSNYGDTNGSLFLKRNQLQNGYAKNKDELANQQQILVNQLFKAAEFIEASNNICANEILARLNQIFPSLPMVGKPIFRTAFYFKEALLQLINNIPLFTTALSTPMDVILKLNAYKTFSDISPIVQFTNFTSIQAILEEVNGYNSIHIIDFDIGVGAKWSSFMQELSSKRGECDSIPSLKITAFASNASDHPLELHLTSENLSHFAKDLNIPFEFNVLSLDSFDPLAFLGMSSNNSNQAIAVNFPIGTWLNHQSMDFILRFVKQLNPKIVVSIDHGCDRSELPFSHHFLHAFQSCTILLDSVDAFGLNHDVVNKIEKYLVQPRIENVMLGRYRAMGKTMPWRSLFDSIGLTPIQFSSYTKTQAECLLKRVQVSGFQLEKKHDSMLLCWQRGELVSVSAWK